MVIILFKEIKEGYLLCSLLTTALVLPKDVLRQFHLISRQIGFPAFEFTKAMVLGNGNTILGGI